MANLKVGDKVVYWDEGDWDSGVYEVLRFDPFGLAMLWSKTRGFGGVEKPPFLRIRPATKLEVRRQFRVNYF